MMKNWIRKKIAKWLRIDTRINIAIDTYIKTLSLKIDGYGSILDDRCKMLTSDIRRFRQELLQEIAQRQQLYADWKEFKALIDLGVDVGMKRDPSWAVICIAGKMEYLRFVELQPREIMELREWLRHFEGCNKVIDTPPGMRQWFIK